MSFHRGPYLQRGRGIGNIFSSILKRIIPAAKVLGKNFLSSPITKSVLREAKDSAINAGINIATDVMQGDNVGQTIHKNINKMKKNMGPERLGLVVANLAIVQDGQVVHGAERGRVVVSEHTL